MELDAGGTALLTCKMSKPEIAVQWRKGSVLLRPGDKYKMMKNGCELQFEIHDLTSEDRGTYGCYADTAATTAMVLVKGVCNHLPLSIISFSIHALIWKNRKLLPGY